MKIKIEHNQNLTDIAVQYYGTADGVWAILEKNPNLRGIDDIIAAGQFLEIDDNIDNALALYRQRKGWLVGTGEDILPFKNWKRSAFSGGFN